MKLSCPPKVNLKKRKLFNRSQAEDVAALFSLFADPSRLRMLHALVREGDLGVNQLAGKLGMKVQAVSNQLQGMARKGVLEASRKGKQVFYRIADPCIPELLDRGACLNEESKLRQDR